MLDAEKLDRLDRLDTRYWILDTGYWIIINKEAASLAVEIDKKLFLIQQIISIAPFSLGGRVGDGVFHASDNDNFMF